jgi:hypothetical protein
VVDHGFALAKYRADERGAAQAVAAAVVAVGAGVFILASDLQGWRNALDKVAMKRAADRPPQGTPRHRGNGRNEFWQSSNAQCEQCNHTHSENQHCKCYRIVVQPMQPLLHGTPPVSDQSWESESATETTCPVALGSAVQKGRAAQTGCGEPKVKTRHWAKVVAGFPAPAL